MKKQDYYFFGLAGLNIYLFIQFLNVFSDTNLVAIFEHRQIFAYVAAAATLVGIIFCFRNFVRSVSLFSGNFSEVENDKFLHAMAIDTVIILCCLAILAAANTYMFYFFNYMVL